LLFRLFTHTHTVTFAHVLHLHTRCPTHTHTPLLHTFTQFSTHTHHTHLLPGWFTFYLDLHTVTSYFVVAPLLITLFDLLRYVWLPLRLVTSPHARLYGSPFCGCAYFHTRCVHFSPPLPLLHTTLRLLHTYYIAYARLDCLAICGAHAHGSLRFRTPRVTAHAYYRCLFAARPYHAHAHVAYAFTGLHGFTHCRTLHYRSLCHSFPHILPAAAPCRCRVHTAKPVHARSLPFSTCRTQHRNCLRSMTYNARTRSSCCNAFVRRT